MKATISAICMAFFATAAIAAGPTFADADTNGDGVLSMEEVKAALPDASDEDLTAGDINQDGEIDENEYAALTGA